VMADVTPEPMINVGHQTLLCRGFERTSDAKRTTEHRL